MAHVEAYAASRALAALELLAFRRASAPQVARALKVDARTARRLLERLVADGWASREHDGRRRTYRASLRIVALASHAGRAPLARAAEPFVAALHERTGAACSLAVPSYRSVLNLTRWPDGALPRSVPCHCAATGKVLLAHRTPWRESVLARPLMPRTVWTTTNADALRAEAAEIRDRGHAFEDREQDPGLCAVAAPVTSAQGEVIAALGAAVPAASPLADLAAQTERMAAALSAALR